MNLNYIIIDDDEMQIDYLQVLLEKFKDVTCLATFTNPLEARQKIQELQPDFLFLDIEMPDLNGVQLIKSLSHPPAVIFTTSHLGYAVDAFDVEAIDYLVKPVTTERLIRALDKVKTAIELRETAASKLEVATDHFFIRDNNSFVKIMYKDVEHIESSGNFSFIHTIQQSKQIVLANLSKMQEQLPEDIFVRISRTHIINKQYIQSINTEQVQLLHHQIHVGKQFAEQAIQTIIGNNAIRRK